MSKFFFRHAGWVVDGGTYLETDAAFYERIRHAHYDIVGLSVGAASVDAISDTIRHIRSDSRNMNVKIALGGPAIAYDPKRFLPAGADLLSADVRTAVEKANTLIAAG